MAPKSGFEMCLLSVLGWAKHVSNPRKKKITPILFMIPFSVHLQFIKDVSRQIDNQMRGADKLEREGSLATLLLLS